MNYNIFNLSLLIIVAMETIMPNLRWRGFLRNKKLVIHCTEHCVLSRISEYSLRNTCLKAQPSHLFIGVAMETTGCCDIESTFIDAAVDAASICQVLLSLVNSKINYEFLSD